MRGPRGGGRARAWQAMATAEDRKTARQMPPPVGFWTAMARMVGIRSRSVIGVISRYHFVY